VGAPVSWLSSTGPGPGAAYREGGVGVAVATGPIGLGREAHAAIEAAARITRAARAVEVWKRFMMASLQDRAKGDRGAEQSGRGGRRLNPKDAETLARTWRR
jgi:hypothetical protein